MKIIKRDGRKVQYDFKKVCNAISKAMLEVNGEVDEDCVETIEEIVWGEVGLKHELGLNICVENIQNIIEVELMKKYPQVAKAYILYRSKRNEVRKNPWNMNELQRNIWESKYQNEDEDFIEFIDRVSGGNSEVNKIIRNQDFLFGGRILAGRGLDRNVSLSNCYVMPRVDDNLESIFDTAGKLARTYSYGGGCGLSLSKLRPNGSPVNNSAETTTGPVSFMELYSTTTDIIGQKGRRGALMISMDIDHPDIIEFVNSKSNVNNINSANISVEANDNFFEKSEDEHNKKVLNEIARNNWETGEPGMLFWDRIEEWHLLSEHPEYELHGVNPCVVGDTKILTDKGNIEIEKLVGQEVNVWNGYEFSKVTPRITGLFQEILDVELSNGSKISCTPNHEFILKDGTKVKAKNLRTKDKLYKWEYPIIKSENEDSFDELTMYTQGFFSGDGTHLVGNRIRSYICLYNGKIKLKDKLDYSNSMGVYNGNRVDLELDYNKYNDKLFVPSVEYSIKDRLYWLAGILDSDGTKNDVGGSLSVSSIELDFLRDIQFMLSTLGVASTISTMYDESMRLLPNGKGGQDYYHCQESYRLIISAFNVKKLMDLGLETHRVELVANPNRDASRFIYIKSITERELLEDKVYCFTEPKNNTGIFNGIMTGQCAEQPLPKYGNCLLGSINLSNFVINPFTEDAEVDYDRLSKVVGVATVGLNEVLDEGIPLHPLKEQRDTARNFRQIGLGIMGLADMFIKLGITYGSYESLLLSQKLGQLIRDSSIRKSIDLAKEYEPYPAFNIDYIKKSDYFKSLSEDIQDDILKYGMRNSHVLSIAPTGSISTMLGISGGIEPIFSTSYTRTTKSLSDDGDMDYKVYTEVIKELMDNLGIKSEKDLPNYVVTSHEIEPQNRIQLQSMWQEVIDSAISSTINLEEDATVEDIETIYRLAWLHGLKGITVFRNNCFRVGILTTDSDDEDVEDCGT